MDRNRHHDFLCNITKCGFPLIFQIMLLLLLLYHKIGFPEHACLIANDQSSPPQPTPLYPHCCDLARCDLSKFRETQKKIKKRSTSFPWVKFILQWRKNFISMIIYASCSPVLFWLHRFIQLSVLYPNKHCPIYKLDKEYESVTFTEIPSIAPLIISIFKTAFPKITTGITHDTNLKS